MNFSVNIDENMNLRKNSAMKCFYPKKMSSIISNSVSQQEGEEEWNLELEENYAESKNQINNFNSHSNRELLSQKESNPHLTEQKWMKNLALKCVTLFIYFN